MRIRVPLEVALAIIALVVALWVIIGMGHLSRWLEGRFSPRTVRRVVGVLGLCMGLAGAFIFSGMLFEQDRHDPVYRGLAKFDLGEVIAVAVLWGAWALCWTWSGLKILGALLAFAGGALLIAKPVFWPLLHFYKGVHAFGLTSETHLYFMLSGAGLILLAFILLARRLLRHKA